MRSDLPDNSVFTVAGTTNRDVGRGTGYTFRYGNWLVGINAHYTDTYTMPLPPDFTSAKDLVSGATLSGPIVLAPKTSMVFYLASTAPSATLPQRTLYTGAVAGNASVTVGWNPASGAASYNVLRSTTSGTGYVTLATGVTANSYTDPTAGNGTAYYYVVQSVNTVGTSGNSPEATATPSAPQSTGLPTPWDNFDIGTSTGGFATISDGTFTLKSGPGDTYSTVDGCHFVYQPLIGDGTVIARVQSQSSTNTYAKAGLCIRSSLAAGATRFVIAMEQTGRAEFDYRGSDGAITTSTAYGSGLALPYWVRLTRQGCVVIGYVSANGTTWTPVGSNSATALSACAYVGLVTSPANGSAGQTNTAVFTNVSFPLGATAAPATPTSLVAVGAETSVSLTWNAVAGAVSYRVKRASGIGGPFTTVANVPVGTSFTDNGLPIGASVYYIISAVNDAGESANSSAVSAAPTTPPPTVTGLTATASSGQVGLAWTAVPSATSYTVRRGTQSGVEGTMLASGLTGTAYVDTSVVAGTIYLYSVTAFIGGSEGENAVVDATPPGLPAPWLTQDIGPVGAVGGGWSTDGLAFTVTGSGSDIWSAADEFRYVCQTVTGDCDFVARVADMTNTAPWAKAGVMIRNTLDANSSYALMMVTPGSGVSFQQRTATGANASTVATTGGIVAPYWVRISRVGNAIPAYSSADDVSWAQLGSTQTIAMNVTCQVGLAVSSHNDGTRCVADFDHVLLNGVVPSAPTALTAAAGNHTITLAWTAPASATSYNVKRSLTSGSGYAVVASGITGTAYTDPNLTNRCG